MCFIARFFLHWELLFSREDCYIGAPAAVPPIDSPLGVAVGAVDKVQLLDALCCGVVVLDHLALEAVPGRVGRGRRRRRGEVTVTGKRQQFQEHAITVYDWRDRRGNKTQLHDLLIAREGVPYLRQTMFTPVVKKFPVAGAHTEVSPV